MTLPPLSVVFLLALATYRITRLIVTDEITAEPREAVQAWARAKRSKLREKVAYLLSCPWCAGFYVAVGLTVLWWHAPTVAWWVVVPSVLSACAGVLAVAVTVLEGLED